MLTFRSVKERDFEPLVKMATRSFAQYPLFAGPFRDHFAHSRQYLHFLDKLQRIQIRTALNHSLGLVGLENGKIVTAAFVNPVQQRLSVQDYIHNGGLALAPYLAKVPMMGFLKRLDEAESVVKQKVCDNDWFMSFLAVTPEAQGRHFGSEMINAGIVPELSKLHGGALALTTNTLANTHFYEHNQFEVVKHQLLTIGKAKVDNWGLIREF